MPPDVKRDAFAALLILTYLAIPVLSMTQADERGPIVDFDLDASRWKNRVIILFAPSQSDPAFRLQKQDLEDRAQDVVERDIVILESMENGESRMGDKILSEKAAENIRNRLGVRSGSFDVLLIGKDGGVKLRSDQPVPAQDIFVLIDSMPMRRQEMNSR